MRLSGNIVTPEAAGFGWLEIENDLITNITLEGDIKVDQNWLLPGFIESHLHGLGDGDMSYEGMKKMAAWAVKFGVTGLCPTMASTSPEETVKYLKYMKELSSRSDLGCKLLGSHLEGPFLDMTYKGGMNPKALRMPDVQEVQNWLNAAEGSLRLVTIAPELPGATEVIKLLAQNNVTVSAGHSAMTVADIEPAAQAGLSRACHLFDAYPGRTVYYGVPEVSVVDAFTLDDRIMLELILDGHHVPPALVKLTIRAAGADRIIGITDSMTGAGLPDGEYLDEAGRVYTLNNAEVCRLKDRPEIIVGSCITMNRLFNNLITRFECTPVMAAKIASTNAARSLHLDHITGALQVGLKADLAVLASDMLTVRQTFVDGRCCYEA